VTLAEPTPVSEAQGRQEDLERAGIHPWAWVNNNSILEIKIVESVADRVAIIPLLAHEPVGQEQLAALVMGGVAAPVGR
jgi:arsenite-transporting ATPase